VIPEVIGREVVVTGTLFEHITANHYTDVLMRVSTVRTGVPPIRRT